MRAAHLFLESILGHAVLVGLDGAGQAAQDVEAFGVAAVLACASDVSLPSNWARTEFFGHGKLVGLGPPNSGGLARPWRAQWATSLLTIPTFPLSSVVLPLDLRQGCS